jgi:hypothetical protein
VLFLAARKKPPKIMYPYFSMAIATKNKKIVIKISYILYGNCLISNGIWPPKVKQILVLGVSIRYHNIYSGEKIA